MVNTKKILSVSCDTSGTFLFGQTKRMSYCNEDVLNLDIIIYKKFFNKKKEKRSHLCRIPFPHHLVSLSTYSISKASSRAGAHEEYEIHCEYNTRIGCSDVNITREVRGNKSTKKRARKPSA